jgi:Tat protein translocase TatB subunit
MFDLGLQELVVIFFVALLVFGPKKLPELARTLGKWITEVRRGFYQAKSQIETEFDQVRQDTVTGIDTQLDEVQKQGSTEQDEPHKKSGEGEGV